MSDPQLIVAIGDAAGRLAVTFRRIADATEQKDKRDDRRDRLLGLATLWSDVRLNISGVDNADEPPHTGKGKA
jgi:hypothetical protein